MAGINLTSIDAAFKTRYTRKFRDNMVFGPNKLYGALKKTADFNGRTLNYPVKFGLPQGGSQSFTQAQANMATAKSQVAQFALTRVHDFSMVSLDNETRLASQGEEGAFFGGAFEQTDGNIKSCARRLNISLYRSGWGDVGISASTSTTAVTLTNKEDAVNFEIGQTYVGATTQSSSALNAAGASATVVAVDRRNGIVTFSATMATICPAGSYLFVAGDRENSATPTMLKPAGLDAWLPPAGPTATLFFGINRTTDTRLGGLTFDASGGNIEEGLIDAGLQAQREGGDPDFLVTNTKNYGDLLKSIGTKFTPTTVKTGDIGFDAIKLHLPSGELTVFGDRDCPVNVAYMLQSNTWEWHGLDDTGPGPLYTADGGKGFVTSATEDAIEMRVGWYGNLACYAPGWNTRIKLA